MKLYKKIIIFLLTFIFLTNIIYLFWGDFFYLTFSKEYYRSLYLAFNICSTLAIVFLVPLLLINRTDKLYIKLLKTAASILSPILAFASYFSIAFDGCNFWQYNTHKIIEYKNKDGKTYIALLQYRCPAPGGPSFERRVKIVSLNRYFDYIKPIKNLAIDSSWIKIDNYCLTGFVLDKYTRRPIQGAFLKINKGDLCSECEIYSSTDGSFTMNVFESNTKGRMHKLFVRKKGYLSHAASLSNLAEKDTVCLDTIYLQPIR